MNNQPWECPRCHKMNAPFIPSCSCKSNLLNPAPIGIPYNKSIGTPFSDVDKRCKDCGAFHGIYNGQSIQCVSL